MEASEGRSAPTPLGVGYAGVMEPADCVNCHLRSEERHAFPYLPRHFQAWLRAEHDRLRRQGFPAQAVIDHSVEEMAIFRRYCPPEVIAQIEDDHDRFDDVLQALAGKDLCVPGDMRIG